MSQVISFVNVIPSARFDSLAWTQVRVQEAATEDGTYTTIDTIILDPVEPDPTDPLARSFTTENGTDVDLWYRVIFVDADGDVSQPSDPVQNTSSAFTDSVSYATVEEFFRRIKIRAPDADQTAAAERVLAAAAGEIDAELDRAGDSLQGWELSLAAEVNLERAEEHWSATAFGVIGLGGELGSSFTARDSWERYALKLAPLKEQWGLA